MGAKDGEGGNLLVGDGIGLICCVGLLVVLGGVALVVVLVTRRAKKE